MAIHYNPDTPRPPKGIEKQKLSEKKTRQSKFMETYPRAELDENGVLDICPRSIDRLEKCAAKRCRNCKKEFWSKEEQEVENG